MKLRILLITIVSVLLMPMTTFAGQWEKGEYSEWHYLKDNGQYAQGEWITDGGKDYYIALNCEMLVNNYTPDGYWVGADGVWDQSKGHRQGDAYAKAAMYVWENEIEAVSYSIYYYSDDMGDIVGEVEWNHSSSYAGRSRLTYYLMELGAGTYMLLHENNGTLYYDKYVAATEDGNYLMVTSGGETTVLYLAEYLYYN